MKNLKTLVIALALVIGVSSCKKEEKAVVVASSSIVGTWDLTYTENYFYLMGNLVFLGSGTVDGLYTLEFKNDGTVKSSDKVEVINGTYFFTENGKFITLNFPVKSLKYQFEIKSLYSSELVLFREELSEGTAPKGGKYDKFTVLNTFKRI